MGLLSDLLLTLSSHTVSPPARRLFNSPRWSLFPLSCNQWLPPLELLMSPHWLHWDCCQVTEDSCSGWLLLAHHWLGWWEHSFAYSFEFVDLCSRPVLTSSQMEWREEKYTKTSRFSHFNVCASVPTGPLPRLGPQSWRSFRSRWRKKTSVQSNWSTLLTGICHWLAWMSRSLDRSSSQTQMRRTTERGMSHPNTTI